MNTSIKLDTGKTLRQVYLHPDSEALGLTFLNEQPSLLSLIREMKDGVALFTQHPQAILTNSALVHLLQSDNENVFDACQEIFDAEALLPLVQSVIQHGESHHHDIKWLLRHKKLYVSLSFIPMTLQHSNGSTETACVCIFHDQTAIRRTEKMRRDFVANVSHELRTPLSAIHGYAETLLDGAMHDETVARQFIDIIFRHSSRLSQLVTDLLDLSKLESPDFSLDLESLPINRLIRSVISLGKPQADNKEVSIEFKPHPDIQGVLGHTSTLEQVLTNLLDNAIKYTPHGGDVCIKTMPHTSQSDWVQIHISDSGIGIAPKHLPRLFERFYRVDKARSRNMGGTGLGLSICKHIIQSHGGDIWVQSAVGEGTTFTFTLKASPLSKQQQ